MWERRQNRKVLMLWRRSKEVVSLPKLLLFALHRRSLGVSPRRLLGRMEVNIQNVIFPASKRLPMTLVQKVRRRRRDVAVFPLCHKTQWFERDDVHDCEKSRHIHCVYQPAIMDLNQYASFQYEPQVYARKGQLCTLSQIRKRESSWHSLVQRVAFTPLSSIKLTGSPLVPGSGWDPPALCWRHTSLFDPYQKHGTDSCFIPERFLVEIQDEKRRDDSSRGHGWLVCGDGTLIWIWPHLIRN